MSRFALPWLAALWLALLAPLCLIIPAHAGPPEETASETPAVIVIRSGDQRIDLTGRSRYWIDREGRLDAGDIEARQHTLPWATRGAGLITPLGEHDALWIQFDAWVQDTDTHWELELARTGTDLVTLHHRDRLGQWRQQQAGDRLPVAQWHARDRFPVFTLDSRTDRPVRYWLRIEHARVPYSGELFIQDHLRLREQRTLEQFLLGGYFGLSLLLMVMALGNGLVFRDASFFTYALYTGLMAITMAVSMGVGGQLLWPRHAGWSGQAEFLLLPLTAIAGLMFISKVIQLRSLHRGLDRLALGIVVVWLAVVAWDQVLPSVTSMQAVSLMGAVSLGFTVLLLVLAWRLGEPWARWIALGFVPIVLAGTLPVLRNFNLLPAGFLSQYGMVTAAAVEAPMLIYGLIQRSSRRHEAQARARALELTEPLTGLTNRHNCILRLHDSLVRAQRYRHQSALLVINLDNHDWFQSTHGREVADRALVLTGSLLRSAARDVDTAARIDDQTFALVMEGPVRGPQAVAAATAILAGGLRPSTQLPVGATLRYKIVIALLPDPSIDLPMDAQQHLAWLHDEANALHWDKQRNIATVNF